MHQLKFGKASPNKAITLKHSII